MPETQPEMTAAEREANNVAQRLVGEPSARNLAALRIAFLTGANWQLKRLLPNRGEDHADHDRT